MLKEPEPPPSAYVYVDGFNLYRRVLADRPELKWLDLELLCDRVLGAFDVQRIRYFTARIRPIEGEDPRAPSRQQAYLRALATLPRVSLHYGSFRVDKRWMPRSPLILDERGTPELVRVRKVEEKGTDVSLAAHMVFDAARSAASNYFLLSNDSDFAEGLRLVRATGSAEIGLTSPSATTAAKSLLALDLDHIRHLRENVLRNSQLPDVVHDGDGSVRRPTGWRVSRPDEKSTEAPLVSGASRPVAEASGGVISP